MRLISIAWEPSDSARGAIFTMRRSHVRSRTARRNDSLLTTSCDATAISANYRVPTRNDTERSITPEERVNVAAEHFSLFSRVCVDVEYIFQSIVHGDCSRNLGERVKRVENPRPRNMSCFVEETFACKFRSPWTSAGWKISAISIAREGFPSRYSSRL